MPSSDQLSAEVELQALVPRPARGRLKIYIGSAAGVGKTYRMLQEAHDLRRRGVDVVIAVIETHGRRETTAQLGELEVVPLRQLEYRGVSLHELDLDAVIERRPQIALVDELAHSNVPGVQHTKRWEDVLALLDAGVSVISAMNVQHLESLNPIVEQTLGVSVRETVPDWMLARADQVVSIDLPADELRQRLLDGKIYAPDKISRALEHFFTEENLTTLRELALREVASSVDREREGIVRRESGRAARATQTADRIMVAMASHPTKTAALLHKASRIAGRLNTDWYCVYVQTSAERADRIEAEQQRHLVDNIQLAERMGAEYVKLVGEDIAGTLLAFARQHGVALILVGQSRRSWWQRLQRRSVVNALLRQRAGVDVLVVSDSRARAGGMSNTSDVGAPRADGDLTRLPLGDQRHPPAPVDGQAQRAENLRRSHDALLEQVAATVSTQLEEARMALHILQTSPFGELNENQEELVSAARHASEVADRDLRRFRRLVSLSTSQREATRESIPVPVLLEPPLAAANATAHEHSISVSVTAQRDLAPAFVERVATQEALTLMLTAVIETLANGSEVRIVVHELPGDLVLRIEPGVRHLHTPSLPMMLASALLEAQSTRVSITESAVLVHLPMPPARVWHTTAAHSVQQ